MCEADPQQLQPASSQAEAAEQELLLCKKFLAEAQDDVQQLQAQLAAAIHSAAAAAGTNARLQGELAATQQQRTQLQQQLAEATQTAKAQLAAANALAVATRQQLSDAKQALVAMQKGMRELQLPQQQQAEQWAVFAAEAADKHAAVKAQAAAGVCPHWWWCCFWPYTARLCMSQDAAGRHAFMARTCCVFFLLLHLRPHCSKDRAAASAGSSRAAGGSHGRRAGSGQDSRSVGAC